MGKCQICNKEFENEHSLDVHMINEHENWGHYHGDIKSSFGCADQKMRVETVANNAEGTVLSVGCGDGNVEKAILNKGLDITVSDIDPKRVENSKKLFGLTKGFVANAKDLSIFPNRSFDTVICCETLEHIRDMGEALQELIRVAKKKIIITFPISDLWDMDETHQFMIRATIVSRDGKANEVHNKQDDTKASFIVLVMEKINGNI